jgi:uncharacterized membrane protein YGL010W
MIEKRRPALLDSFFQARPLAAHTLFALLLTA